MKVKVCGMRDSENIKALAALEPDFMGFIFYDKSLRNVIGQLDEELLNSLPKKINKVGVFVNSNIDFVITNARKYGIKYLQLHGNETPDYCKTLGLKGFIIIKAFKLDNDFIFSQLNNYKPYVDYFLFDAKGDQLGGNGHTFDWSILSDYVGDKPYFLAGGIDLENAEFVNELNPPPFSIDVNSKFEIEPALKDIEKLAELMKQVHLEGV